MDKRKILLSPWTILASMVIGGVIGVYFKDVATYLKPIGEIYISVLQMCVIPIVGSAILMSIGKLVKSERAAKYAIKITLVFLGLLISISILTTGLSMLGRPLFAPDAETISSIGRMMLDNEDAGQNYGSSVSVIKEIDSRYNYADQEKKEGIADFIISIIPKNIFTALSNGENLKIVFFFFVMGIMLKFISDKSYESFMVLAEGVYELFQKVISWAMNFLCFALCALTATQFSSMGMSIISTLIKIIILIYLVSLIIFLICSVLMWKFGGGTYTRQFRVLRDTIMICLATRNSFAAIPSAIAGLHKGLNMDPDKVNLTIPLGITLCRSGTLITFSVAAVYATQLYNSKITAETLVIIVITGILASVAASGAPSIVAKTMVALILTPLGLPSGAIIIILVSIDPIIDPVITLMNVFTNCTAATIISHVGSEERINHSEDLGMGLSI
ncbi:MAG: dicarboxylate/amino acid:cation symporter [Mobilitalea sp.]